VKPPAFDYVRVESAREALELLPALGPDARLLAGGQSLIPMLSMRVARPTTLLDIGGLDQLNRMGVVDGDLYIGALVRHQAVATGTGLPADRALLATAAAHIGHAAIRHRGTIGGSLAHADPCSELLAVTLLFDAVVTAESTSGGRQIPVRELVLGPYETALRPDEMLTWIRVPPQPVQRTGFYEVARRPGDFAAAGAAVAVPSGGAGEVVAVVFGPGAAPVRRTLDVGDLRDAAAADVAAALCRQDEDDRDARLRRGAVVRALRAAGVTG
jgi:carbon-monoxide dehydrogenase medium subunit